MMQRKEGAPRRVRIAGQTAGRWAVAVWLGLVTHHSGGFSRRQYPQNRSPRPPLGGTGELFLHKKSGVFFGENGKGGNFCGAIASRISSEFFPAVGGL